MSTEGENLYKYRCFSCHVEPLSSWTFEKFQSLIPDSFSGLFRAHSRLNICFIDPPGLTSDPQGQIKKNLSCKCSTSCPVQACVHPTLHSRIVSL